ncbi:MAG: two-component system, OmpR family, response regulator [Solirubrobacterales bacterium]|jgi:DNA-binding response OmpR family regulator|nr:two-component system, OmpR family, response regulator [Solirubrobacterales bacterium]
MRILIVEDERPIAEFVQRGLEAEGYSVTCAYDGEEGLTLAGTGDYALVVLDVLLPKLSGLEVVKGIRERDDALPVIMLTALAETDDVVTGLDLGASDYLTKPFAFAELLARVRAHLRQPGQASGTSLEVGRINLDFRSREVNRAGEGVKLTAREFELLAYLMRHPDQVLSRAQILNAVWGYDYDPGTNVLDVYIGYLRRKLADAEGDAPIQTVRSAGYRLVSSDA